MATCCRERDLVQKEGLHQLRFDDGARHLDDGLVGQDDPALGDCVDVAGEAQAGEGVHDIGREAGAGQPGQVVVLEGEGLKVGQAVLEPSRDQEPSVDRQRADEQAEGGGTHHPTSQVAGRHVELVEIGDQRLAHRQMIVDMGSGHQDLRPWPPLRLSAQPA